MDLNNWLLWLMIGLVVGFLIEFLVDYFFFGHRNKDLENQMDQAKAEARQLQKSTDDLKTELAQAAAAQLALQTRVDEVTAGAATNADILPLVAGAGGLVGALGDSLLHADRVGTAFAVAALEEALVDRDRLEQTVRELRSSDLFIGKQP